MAPSERERRRQGAAGRSSPRAIRATGSTSRSRTSARRRAWRRRAHGRNSAAGDAGAAGRCGAATAPLRGGAGSTPAGRPRQRGRGACRTSLARDGPPPPLGALRRGLLRGAALRGLASRRLTRASASASVRAGAESLGAGSSLCGRGCAGRRAVLLLRRRHRRGQRRRQGVVVGLQTGPGEHEEQGEQQRGGAGDVGPADAVQEIGHGDAEGAGGCKFAPQTSLAERLPL